MKTLIKTYYREPKVDVCILSRALEQKTAKYSIDVFLLPIIGIGILTLIFASFLLDVNKGFLGVAINLYTSVGGIWFLVFDILVGIFYFIILHRDVIIPFLTLLLVGQAGILGFRSLRRT